MTTDIKADQMDQYTSSSGRVWVPLTDHELVVGELTKELDHAYAAVESKAGWEWKSDYESYKFEAEILRAALAASRAEVEGLKSVANHARNLAAWFSSGNSVPVDGVHTMKLSSHTVLDDARLLRNALAAMENNNV